MNRIMACATASVQQWAPFSSNKYHYLEIKNAPISISSSFCVAYKYHILHYTKDIVSLINAFF